MIHMFVRTGALLLRLLRRGVGPMSIGGFGGPAMCAGGPESGAGGGKGDGPDGVDSGAEAGGRWGRMKRRLRHMTAPLLVLTR